MSTGRWLTLLIGLGYSAIAAAAVFAAPAPLADASPSNVFAGFGVDWLLTTVHAALGLGGLAAAAARSEAVRRVYGLALTAVGIGLVAFGVPAAANQGPDALFNLRWGNVVVYALTVALGLLIAFGVSRKRRSRRAEYLPASTPETRAAAETR